MKTLTSAAVAKMKPGAVRCEIRDGGAAGLYLVVQPSGAKSWALRLRRPSGKTAKLTLGTVDLSGKEIEGDPVIGQPLSLAAARRLAADVARQRLAAQATLHLWRKYRSGPPTTTKNGKFCQLAAVLFGEPCGQERA
jgi:hypothetical protein